MTMTDPIADMLTRLRNAIAVKKETVLIPDSRLKRALCRLLADEGYVGRIEIADGERFAMIRVHLKYDESRERAPVLHGLERVSKPGRRIYRGKSEIPWVRSGMGTAIVSTSKGVVTDREARRLGVGGEILCRVW